jgi:hypothetical protein
MQRRQYTRHGESIPEPAKYSLKEFKTAPAGPCVFVQLVPRKLFHFGVQGKRKLSLLSIVFFNRETSAAAHVPTDCV